MKSSIFSLVVLFSSVIALPTPTPQDAAEATGDIAAAPSGDTSSAPTGDNIAAALAQNPSVVPDVNSTDFTASNTTVVTDSKSGCKDMTVIFARGTTETGDLGALAGPPFVKALALMVGKANIDVQGVPAPVYPADIIGFLAGGSATGSAAMLVFQISLRDSINVFHRADMVTATLSACPNTKVVMSGYSQGGQLVHNAAKLLPASTMAKVDSVVIFGDPDFGTPVQGIAASKQKIICHAGDNICAHGTKHLA